MADLWRIAGRRGPAELRERRHAHPSRVGLHHRALRPVWREIHVDSGVPRDHGVSISALRPHSRAWRPSPGGTSSPRAAIQRSSGLRIAGRRTASAVAHSRRREWRSSARRMQRGAHCNVRRDAAARPAAWCRDAALAEPSSSSKSLRRAASTGGRGLAERNVCTRARLVAQRGAVRSACADGARARGEPERRVRPHLSSRSASALAIGATTPIGARKDRRRVTRCQ